MKAERRHELKENDLANLMDKCSAYMQENGGRLALAVVGVLVAVAVVGIVVRSRDRLAVCRHGGVVAGASWETDIGSTTCSGPFCSGFRADVRTQGLRSPAGRCRPRLGHTKRIFRFRSAFDWPINPARTGLVVRFATCGTAMSVVPRERLSAASTASKCRSFVGLQRVMAPSMALSRYGFTVVMKCAP